MIPIRPLVWIQTRSITMLDLKRCGADMCSSPCVDLFRARRPGHSADAAVITHPRVGRSSRDTAPENMCAGQMRQVIKPSIVVESVLVPISTLIADASIAVAVVDVAIISDVVSPIAVAEEVVAIVPRPITRSPKEAWPGR